MPYPCANCDAPTDKDIKVFCSPRCREQAKLVRFVRKRGWDAFNGEDELMAEAYDHKLRGALGEGYGATHIVTDETKATVLKRDRKRCVKCGSEEGLQVDHIDHLEDIDAFNAATNLQVLCQTCHRKKTLESLIDAPMDEEEKATHRMLMERIDSPQPLKFCDDPERWDTYRKRPYLGILRTMIETGYDEDTIRRSLDKLIVDKAAKMASLAG